MFKYQTQRQRIIFYTSRTPNNSAYIHIGYNKYISIIRLAWTKPIISLTSFKNIVKLFFYTILSIHNRKNVQHIMCDMHNAHIHLLIWNINEIQVSSELERCRMNIIDNIEYVRGQSMNACTLCTIQTR